ncbi:hypothetical protein [uncultured Mesotoga sp.]|uniref:hypothetical protein n=1 Tax=uncultured Mesotoga sp. TaxID=1184400 RepID=UPI0025941395|nr:hypothetical protein [uncultured Mesotoga sp.]
MKSKQALLEILSTLGVTLIVIGAVSLVLLGVISLIGQYDDTLRVTMFGIGFSLLLFGFFLSRGFLNRDMAEDLGEIKLLTRDLDKYIEELAGSRRVFNKVYSDMEGVANINIQTINKYVEEAERRLKEILATANKIYMNQLESANTKRMETEKEIDALLEALMAYSDDLFRIAKEESSTEPQRNKYKALFDFKRRIENTGLLIVIPEIGTMAIGQPGLQIVEEKSVSDNEGTILSVERIGFAFRGRILREAEVVISKAEIEIDDLQNAAADSKENSYPDSPEGSKDKAY